MRDNRIEWVTPLPPLPTGIAGYSADLLAAIDQRWNLDVVPERGSSSLIPDPFDRRKHDAVRRILQIGNSGFHGRAYRLAESGGSLLVLHDVVLHHARLAEFVRRRQGKRYVELMTRLYGHDGGMTATATLRGGSIDGDRFPLSEDLIERAAVVAVHSEHARQRVLALRPDTQVVVIPMGIPLPQVTDRGIARDLLNLPQDRFILVSITHVNPMKRIPVVLRAFRRLLRSRPDSLLVIAGGASDPEGLKRQVRALGLEHWVRISGYVSDDEARLLARAADVAVNLRYPSTGETSASLLRLLGAAIPVVVTRHGSALEVPADAALHLPVDLLEEETLAEYLLWLANDGDAREEIGRNAREFVASWHSMVAAVDGYREAMQAAWEVTMPAIPDRLIHEPAPCVSPTTPQQVNLSNIEETTVRHLVRLGLGGHDGTIESVARQIGRLGLDESRPNRTTGDIALELLAVLACPVCKQQVRLEGDSLVCDSCGRRYRIENGIPVMLIPET